MPNRPVSSRRRSGSDRSEVSISKSAADLTGAMSSRSAANASPTPGRSVSGWRRRVSVKRRRKHLVVALHEQEAGPTGGTRLAQGGEHALGREASGPAVHADGEALRSRGVLAQDASQQVDREIVHRLEAEILENLEAGGPPRPRHARDDDDLVHRWSVDPAGTERQQDLPDDQPVVACHPQLPESRRPQGATS